MNSNSRISIEDISIEVVSKKIKNLNLRITPPLGTVTVTAPHNFPEEKIHHFVRSKMDWIRKHRTRIRLQKWIAPLQYLSGEKHLFLGKQYLLNVVERKGKAGVVLSDESIHSVPSNSSSRPELSGLRMTDDLNAGRRMTLFVKQRSSRKKRQTILDEWYRHQLKQIIPGIIQKYESTMNVHVKEWGIKKMKTKWGTCNITKKRIWLNLELAQKPVHCLEHVIVHELVHLLERKHNSRFYHLMDTFLPEWRLMKAQLPMNNLQ